MRLVQNFVHLGLLVIQVSEFPGLGRTDIDAGRQQPLANPMITPGTFICGLGLGINKANRIGAGLHAVTTGHTTLGINQNKTILGLKGRTDRADLHTGWVLAHIAELRHKKGVAYRMWDILAWLLVPIQAAVRAVNVNVILIVNHVPFHPGSIHTVRHLVFVLIGHTAGAATDTTGNINDKGKFSFFC